MKQAANIKEQKQNAIEFAQIVDNAYNDFQKTSFVKEDGLRCLVTILTDNILEKWSEMGISYNKEKDFIPIQNGLFYICLWDAKGQVIPLR